MPQSLRYSNMNLLWSSLIVSELMRNGIDTFFISPGNRNVPLIAALAENPAAIKRLTIDERASAYRALGHAKASGKAGVLISTSGTAASNYYPAVIEAYEDELPLIVISADRPPELVGSHANQSIEQMNLYGRYTLETLNLPCPDIHYPVDALLAKMDFLISHNKGPVHINCPFREPLLSGEETIPEAYLGRARKITEHKTPVTRYLPVEPVAEDLKTVEDLINQTGRGLVIVGRMASSVKYEELPGFINQLGWPVFCDIASGLRGRIPDSVQIHNLDHPAILNAIQAYLPQTILQFGTGLVSKHYYQTILAEQAATVVLVTARNGVRDPVHRVNIKIPIQIDRFVQNCRITPDKTATDVQTKFLDDIHTIYQKTADAVPADQLSFTGLADILVNEIPNREALFLSNSIAIRAFDAIAFPENKAVEVVSNRGVSGIEGNLATSVGYAEATGKRITAVIGDVSLMHDLNSLMLVGNSQTPVILVVPNNGGGKIFDRLPARNFPGILTPYLTTPHTMTFKHAAAQFELDYQHVDTPQSFRECYRQALEKQRSILIEVSIDPETDLAIFKKTQNVME